MNIIERFKSLPKKSRNLLSLGIILALVIALPLFVWGIIFNNFDIREKAVSGEPIPTPTPTPGNSINWNTPSVSLQADDFYIIANGKQYRANVPDLQIRSDLPNGSSGNYTTLEAVWHENGDEMRLFIYFYSDGTRWWSNEIRTYNGQNPGDWIYYTNEGPLLEGTLGYPYTQNSSGWFAGHVNINGQLESGIFFTNLRVQAFLGRTPPPTVTPSPSPSLSPTPSPSPSPRPYQIYTYRMKLAGVAGDAATGAHVRIRFQNSSGFDYETSPIEITHVGGGIYEAVITFGSEIPWLPNGNYSMYLKGEKHLYKKFCQPTGQVTRCTGTGNILISSDNETRTFDFTGLVLEPGDLYIQDGVANAADFAKITALLGKSCSALTDIEKLTGDLDYNGCVNVRDAFLMRQTLESRYDEI